MDIKKTSTVLALATIFAVGACANASRQPRSTEAMSEPTTVDIQGASEWKRSSHMRAYYEETVATFANGTNIDIEAYEARSFEIFRQFARANGRSEQGMVDHLKLIPRQVVDIVKADPSVLQSYDAFWAALAGPD
jgi:hypothetical protein